MPGGPPQQQGYLRSLRLRLWHRFLVALWRWHPGQTWHFSLQEASVHEHSAQLRSGCYLFCTHSSGVDAVAITDRLHPERRIAWLLTPGWNILWIRLRHEWSQPVFEWLGGKAGIRPDVTLAARRTWGALGWLPSLARVAIACEMTNLEDARYCVLWPMLQLPSDDPWGGWALSVGELLYLNLEIPALGKSRAKPAALPTSSSILSGIERTSPRARLGVVAHLHYLAPWPEICNSLRLLPSDARLFLTISDGAVHSGDITTQSVLTEMAAERPDAFIRILPNIGRDVGPFMRLLAEGRFDGLDCVCKIHGKNSLRGGKKGFFGEIWRQYALETLLPDPESIEQIGRYFTASPQLGILGPARLRLPNKRVTKTLDDDQDLLHKLMLSCFGRDVTEQIVFFAGTMFWFRPEALELLRYPPAGGWAFATEPAPDQGSLAHALERLLPTSALLAGYSVESLPETEEDLTEFCAALSRVDN